MPETDYRALCEQLMEFAEGKRYDGGAVIQRARAALAQPEPVAPTDEELLLMACMTGLVYGNGCGAFPSSFMEGTDTTREILAFARAALARWGTPANNTINYDHD